MSQWFAADLAGSSVAETDRNETVRLLAALHLLFTLAKKGKNHEVFHHSLFECVNGT